MGPLSFSCLLRFLPHFTPCAQAAARPAVGLVYYIFTENSTFLCRKLDRKEKSAQASRFYPRGVEARRPLTSKSPG